MMKMNKKIRIFALVTTLLMVLGTVSAFATDKLDKDISGENLTFAERFEYVLQGSVTGMLMVFAVLALLCFIVYLARVLLYDMPNKKKEKMAAKPKSEEKQEEANTVTTVSNDTSNADASGTNDGELVAVITAAIAAMLESEEYKNEFAGGFRVVSFKRSSQGAWNRK